MRALLTAMNIPWALTPDAYRNLIAIAGRKRLSSKDTEEKLEMLAAKIGKPLQNTRESYVRDGIAVIPVIGPIFRYANFFTDVSGATSIQELARDFTTALEDTGVTGIVLEIDSPGGEVAGVNEFSKMVAAARSLKPVFAYVGGVAQSGGYWIASAASRIVVDETALLGSIGVVMTARDSSDQNRANGIYEIVSSQSPDKRTSPATEDGRAKLLKTVDALADVFIDVVAQNRGVEPSKVMAEFGQGGSLVGSAAVTVGMADAVGSLEGLLGELSGPGGSKQMTLRGGPVASEKERTNMLKKRRRPLGATEEEDKREPLSEEEKREDHANEGDEPECPECGAVMECPACSKSTAKAVAGERVRIAAIINHAEASGREQLARTLAFDSDMAADAAGKILAAAPKAGAPARNPLDAAMAALAPNPALGAGGGAPGDSEDPVAVGKAIAALANGK